MNSVPLGELVEKVDKLDPRTEFGEGRFTYVDIGSVSQKSKCIEEPQVIPCEEAPSRARQVIAADDVLVSTVRPNLNAVARVHREFDGTIASTGFSVLRPKVDELNSSYLYHWVRTDEFVNKMMLSATGQSYPAVSDKIVKSSKIPLPPLEEQKRIAGILDQADALRRLRTRALDKLNTLGQAIFHEMFGDVISNSHEFPIVKVGEVSDCIVPGRNKPKSFSGDIPWITTAELVHLGWTTGSESRFGLSDQEISEVGARIIPANSVIMTCVGDLGVASIAAEKMVINQQLHSFQCGEKILPEYLMRVLPHQKNWMLMRATQTTLPYMNKTICNSIPIPLPPLELQYDFTQKIQELRKTRSRYVGGFELEGALFASLQHRAFRGEL